MLKNQSEITISDLNFECQNQIFNGLAKILPSLRDNSLKAITVLQSNLFPYSYRTLFKPRFQVEFLNNYLSELNSEYLF